MIEHLYRRSSEPQSKDYVLELTYRDCHVSRISNKINHVHCRRYLQLCAEKVRAYRV